MDCPKCKTEMKKAVISAAVGGVLNVMNGEKSSLTATDAAVLTALDVPSAVILNYSHRIQRFLRINKI